ncbi:Putative PH-like domain superfamily, protein ICln/Lot5/Saf5 [Septoria linicola]|uniref:PH-like domain superfamily, protein ICln/Lot5/Saf5 n=1 Tax=Septoria linicola TaxID=215465 RepID=A0A9Q9AS19_9PEZI|nr:putative PH-like domain superfamily, protein ICln/Lot5/Saf5 [Septoria linicola]USW51103.1 Putative PH-like domain superfamily, protein ICln/Lot5/Saf5 [Septoria linicola]
MAALEQIGAQDRPSVDKFTPLREHHEQTPGTFFNAKPVLHIHAPQTYINLPLAAQQKHASLRALTHPVHDTTPQDGNIRIDNIDVWVTSKHLILYAPSENAGCRILYPAITITAIDGDAVLLELNLSDADTADDDLEYFQLKIFARTVQRGAADAQATAGSVNGTNGTTPSNDATTALYKAIADCQELNPDPPMPGEEGEDGEPIFDETAPGATGWITSENMDQFMDADGNFRMPEGVTFVGGEEEEGADADGVQEPLGEGAGRTRTAAEAGVEREDESKWRATEQ